MGVPQGVEQVGDWVCLRVWSRSVAAQEVHEG